MVFTVALTRSATPRGGHPSFSRWVIAPVRIGWGDLEDGHLLTSGRFVNWQVSRSFP